MPIIHPSVYWLFSRIFHRSSVLSSDKAPRASHRNYWFLSRVPLRSLRLLYRRFLRPNKKPRETKSVCMRFISRHINPEWEETVWVAENATTLFYFGTTWYWFSGSTYWTGRIWLKNTLYSALSCVMSFQRIQKIRILTSSQHSRKQKYLLGHRT